MKIEFRKNKEIITQDDIFKLEKVFSFKLPDDYKSFLLENNGGSFYNDMTFEISGIKDKSVVDVLYGINLENYLNNIQSVSERFKFLEDVLPIGRDVFGNEICLSLKDSTYGFVYFFDHGIEIEELDELSNYVISTSFSQFLFDLKEVAGSEEKIDNLTEIIRSGKLVSLRKLLLNGLDVNQINKSNKTLFEEALFANQLEIASLLIDFGVDYKKLMPKFTGFLNTRLANKIYSNLEHPNITHNGMNAIMFAFLRDNYEVIDALMVKGVFVDKENPKWVGLINNAIRMNKTNSLSKLKEIGFKDSELTVK